MRKEGSIVYIDNSTDLAQWFSGENLDSEYISSANNPLTFKITNSIGADHIINNGIHSNYTLDGQNNPIDLSFDQLYNKSVFYGDNSTICNITISINQLLLADSDIISAAARYNGTIYRWRILYGYCFSLANGTLTNVKLNINTYIWTTATIATNFDYMSICAICDQVLNIDYLVINYNEAIHGVNNHKTVANNYNYGALNSLANRYPLFSNIPNNHSYHRIGFETLDIKSDCTDSIYTSFDFHFNDSSTYLYIYDFYIDDTEWGDIEHGHIRINMINGKIYNGWIESNYNIDVYYTNSQYYSGYDYIYTDTNGVWTSINYFPTDFLNMHNWDNNIWQMIGLSDHKLPKFKTSSYIYKLYDLYIKQNNILNKKNVYIKTNNILQLKEIQRKELNS